jgi:uncharacterized protein (TIGR02594 family)
VKWCAAFVNAVLATEGLHGTGKLNAKSFLGWGQETNDPKPGDIVVLNRGRNPAEGHVGFFAGFDAKGNVKVTGGNQGDEVSTDTFSKKDVVGFRRAPDAADAYAAEAAIAALEERTASTLRLAEATLQGSDAAMRAEAALEGQTEALRHGRDIEEESRRQLNHAIAEGAVQGARSVAGLREEISTRARINSQVSAGAIAAADLNEALSDEAALRPLLQMQALAQGDALTLLTKVVDEYRKALENARAEEGKSAALGAIAGAGQRIADLRALAAFAGDADARAIEEARLAAIREADEKKLKPSDPERQDLIDARIEQARAEIADRKLTSAAESRQEMGDRRAMLEYELSLGGMAADQRDRALALRERELELLREYGPAYADMVREMVAEEAALLDLEAKVDMVRESIREAQAIGEQFVDTVFNPQNWKDWGDLGKRILNDLMADFIRLALLNPIKNELFGQSNPTLGSVLSSLGNAFGAMGGGSSKMGELDPSKGALGLAVGTEHFGGGLTWIAENGPELVELPRGSRVTPAAETRRLFAANDAGPSMSFKWSIDARGADGAAVARLERKLEEMERDMPVKVIAAWSEARARNVIR